MKEADECSASTTPIAEADNPIWWPNTGTKNWNRSEPSCTRPLTTSITTSVRSNTSRAAASRCALGCGRGSVLPQMPSKASTITEVAAMIRQAHE